MFFKTIKIVLIVVLFYNFKLNIFSQNLKNKSAKKDSKNNIHNFLVDSEDNELVEDFYLTDDQIYKKYIEEYKSATADYFYSSYHSTNNPKIKIFILKISSEKGFDNFSVVKLFSDALVEGYGQNSKGISESVKNWRIRIVASYLIQKNIDDLSKDVKLHFANKMLLGLHKDLEERSQASYVLTLAKLFKSSEKKNKDNNKTIESKNKKSYISNKINRNMIIHILNSKLEKIHPKNQFLCWALVKALGLLKSQKSLFLLLKLRIQNNFNQKVMLEISRSLKAITSI